MKRILIIEDDPAIIKGLQESLESEPYEVITSMDGEEGYNTASSENPDLILLDLMLPTMNGQEVCKKLREDGVVAPILMLTSKTEETDKILGLELGADDYITKPCSLPELHARIRAHLRRIERTGAAVSKFSFNNIMLDFKKQKATKDDKSLKLSTKEFEIMNFFARHVDEVVSRDMLLDEVWGYDVFPSTRTVDNYILSLRRKLESDPAHPKHILTVHTSGYRFVSESGS